MIRKLALCVSTLLLASSLWAQDRPTITTVIVPNEGENFNVELGNADIVKFQPTCYGQPGCQDEDGYSFSIDSIIARPQKPMVLLYFGSYPGYYVTLRHSVPLVEPNGITCPDYHDLVIPLRNHSLQLWYDELARVWRPVQ